MWDAAAEKESLGRGKFVEDALAWLHEEGTTMERALQFYADVQKDDKCTDGVFAEIAAWDRFFLGVVVCNRLDLLHPWIYERCREVEANSDGYLDLWSREHFKSSCITFLGTLQEIIRDPEITIGIFSHTRPIAKGFLRQIKRECELNVRLHLLWPHIFWRYPRRESPQWSEDDGIVVRRKSNPAAATVEAHGLVDSQPTSKHFRLMIYDDVVTEKSVTTPEMIIKTTTAWELSRNLSAIDGMEKNGVGVYKSYRREPWYVGTRYSYADTYGVMLFRKAAIPRIYPATHDGTLSGKPVLWSEADWEKKKKESSEFTVACQLLLNPIAGSQQKFKLEWFRRWEIRPETLNIAILVDPANSKKKGSNNSAFAVLGLDKSYNKYLLDGACHKMSLAERWSMLKFLRAKWINTPGVQSVTVGYEKYGMQADLEHFEQMMKIEGMSFAIYPVAWANDTTGSSQRKEDRIDRLIPDHQNWRFFYPYGGENLTRSMWEMKKKNKEYLIAKPILRRNHEGKVYNLVEYFFSNEYIYYPATTNKDFFDAMSRVYDLDINPPAVYKESEVNPQYDGEA